MMPVMASPDDKQIQATAAAPLTPALRRAAERTARYIDAGQADNTKRAYTSAWGTFCRWCVEHGQAPLPARPEIIALYLTMRADDGIKPSTLTTALAAIRAQHLAAGHDSPTTSELVIRTMRGIRRVKGTKPKQAAPIRPPDLREMIDAIRRDDPLGPRDRALLLIGFAGAFRRSELVAIDVEDLEWRGPGLLIHLRRSKTDQEGRGRSVGISWAKGDPLCPLSALTEWMEIAGITEGPIFRRVHWRGQIYPERITDRTVANVIKRRALEAQMDPAVFSGHSLRAGLATSAAEQGVPLPKIATKTGHRSLDTLRGYVRDADLLADDFIGDLR